MESNQLESSLRCLQRGSKVKVSQGEIHALELRLALLRSSADTYSTLLVSPLRQSPLANLPLPRELGRHSLGSSSGSGSGSAFGAADPLPYCLTYANRIRATNNTVPSTYPASPPPRRRSVAWPSGRGWGWGWGWFGLLPCPEKEEESGRERRRGAKEGERREVVLGRGRASSSLLLR